MLGNLIFDFDQKDMSFFNGHDLSALQPGPGSPNQVSLTNILKSNVKFHVPDVKANDAVKQGGPDVLKAKAGQDMKPVADQLNGLEQEYLKHNEMALNEIQEAMKFVDKEMGGQAFNELIPSLAHSDTEMTAVAAVNVATGDAGNAYEIINAVYKEGASVKNEKVNEILAKALKALHESSGPQDPVASLHKEGRPTVHPMHDYSNLKTPEHLRAFVTRNVEHDPVMQEIEDARVGVDDNQECIEYTEQEQEQTFDMLKAQQAAFRGDLALCSDSLTGIVQVPSEIVDYEDALDFYETIHSYGVDPNGSSDDGGMASINDMEPDPQELIMQTATAPGMGARC